MPNNHTSGNDRGKRRMAWRLAVLAVLVVGIMLIVRNQTPTPYMHNSGVVFGTVYNITYQCDSDLHAGIRAQLQRVDASLSAFNEKSTISAVNRNAPHKPDPMFTEVFNMAQDVARETGGAFDITVEDG